MTERPSDRAIAQAFWKACDTVNLDKKALVDLLHRIELDASEIDAAAPEGAQPRCPDCNAAVLFECVACSAGNYPKPEGAQGAAWALAEKVRTDLDRMACPDTFMRAAVESVVANYATPPQPQDAEDAARLQFLIANEFSVRRLSDTRRFVLMSSTGHLVGDRASHTPAEAIDAARAAGGGG